MDLRERNIQESLNKLETLESIRNKLNHSRRSDLTCVFNGYSRIIKNKIPIERGVAIDMICYLIERERKNLTELMGESNGEEISTENNR